MPYITNVAGTTITASWGNANVRDQVVTPFATAAARNSAITSPVEGMLAYLADSNSFEYYTGSAWERFELRPRTAVVTRTTNQSIANATIDYPDWTTEVVDNASLITVTSDTITLSTAGVWLLCGGATFALSGGGDRICYIEHNGAEVEGGGETNGNSATNTIRANVAQCILAAASDTVKLAVYQNTGGSLNIASARLTAMLLSKV